MRLQSLFMAMAVLGITEASAAEATPDVAANVERPARVRVFGQKGIALHMYTNARCEDEYDDEIEGEAPREVKTAAGRSRLNESIGMPETDSTRGFAQKAAASPYYKEYPLAPGQPVMFDAQVGSGSGLRCPRPLQATFVPQAGMDYEADVAQDAATRACTLQIRSVAADGTLAPVQTAPLPKYCPRESASPAPVMTVLFDGEAVFYRYVEVNAGVDELENDKGGVEDLEEAIGEAPLLSTTTVCVVSSRQTEQSPLAKALPGLLAARGMQGRVLRVSAEAISAQWQLTPARPLNFALAEYYCRAAVAAK